MTGLHEGGRHYKLFIFLNNKLRLRTVHKISLKSVIITLAIL